MKTISLSVILFCLFLVISSPQKIAAQLADTPWPMFLHDIRHTGQSPYTVPDSVTLIWKFQTNGEVTSSPSIGSDGTIYFTAEDEPYGTILYALYPSGSLKWSYKLNDDISPTKSTPSIALDGTVYVGASYKSPDACLFAINKSGNLKWKLRVGDIGDNVDSSPAIGPDGTIYIGSDSDTLYAVNPNGKIKWRYGTGHWIRTSPAIGADGTIFIGSFDRNLYAVRSNGTLKWKYKYREGSGIHLEESSPTIGQDGTIYIGSDDGKLYAINQDGSLKWTNEITSGLIDFSPTIGKDGTIYVPYYSDLYAINPDGTNKWDTYLGSSIQSSAIIDSSGIIYCPISYRDPYTTRISLYAINPDGTVKWKFDTSDEFSSSPCIGNDGSIYIGTESGLYCLGEPGSGEIPDLVISNISLDPPMNGTPGVEYRIVAEVTDLTNIASAYCTVSFYYDNFSNFIDSTSIYVPNGLPSYATVSWSTQNFESRDYTIIARVSNSSPAELDTTNNVSQISHTLLPFIQARINAAQQGDTIWVDPGLYLDNITLKNGVMVKSRHGPKVTIIDGRGADIVVKAANLNRSAVLEGFTITNGKGNIVTGGGIDLDLSSATIKNNIIIGNDPHGIKHRGFESAWVERNLIIGHTFGWGVYANNSQAIFINNTIVGNGEGVHAIGFYVPSPTIVNCIFWNNGEDLTYTAVATYSDIQDGDPGTGNISTDPLFVDAEHGDYHLQEGSPCINAGHPDPSFNDPDGSRADMGAFYYTSITFVHSPKESLQPNKYHLAQNYPNPFNPVTTIEYQLPIDTQVTLRIFNIAGELVKILIEEKQSAGYHKIQWNGKDENGNSVAGGLYLLSLESDGFSQSNKMVLIR